MSVSCQGLRSPQDVQEDRTYGIQYGCIGTDPANRFSSNGVRIFKEIFPSMQNIWNTATENGENILIPNLFQLVNVFAEDSLWGTLNFSLQNIFNKVLPTSVYRISSMRCFEFQSTEYSLQFLKLDLSFSFDW